MALHNETGKKGEDIAADFLTLKGYHVLDRNYRFEKSEIDIVALQLEPAELIFVEVRTRTHPLAQTPEDSVTTEKQQRIFRAADAYLYEKQMWTVPVRFDIIAIQITHPDHPLIHHIEDAFRF
ncbi:MAG: YraN family protein [Bacteroidia bacterium]|nr:YraN family protein [Bacteroidia bacterium]